MQVSTVENGWRSAVAFVSAQDDYLSVCHLPRDRFAGALGGVARQRLRSRSLARVCSPSSLAVGRLLAIYRTLSVFCHARACRDGAAMVSRGRARLLRPRNVSRRWVL